jgi:hypothetical protein
MQDTLSAIASHLDSVHHLALFCGVNKAISHEAGIHWARVGKSACGEEYWALNGRYLTMIFMCPGAVCDSRIRFSGWNFLIFFSFANQEIHSQTTFPHLERKVHKIAMLLSGAAVETVYPQQDGSSDDSDSSSSESEEEEEA